MLMIILIAIVIFTGMIIAYVPTIVVDAEVEESFRIMIDVYHVAKVFDITLIQAVDMMLSWKHSDNYKEGLKAYKERLINYYK